MSGSPIQAYEFGEFRLDAVRRLLLRNEEIVPLQPKVFELLLILVQRGNRELTKSELIQILWPDCYVEESNLTQYVFLLRKALGQSHGDHRFIVTIPGRGYRFVEVVRIVGTPSAEASQDDVDKLAVAAGKVRSIAVLPFRSLGMDTQDAYLGYGMADALINRLTHLQGITVRPTDAIIQYPDPSPDPLAAGRQLGVEAVLSGKFQRAGDTIRVTVQLVTVDQGLLLWGQKFDEEFSNLFAVQDSISEQIGTALALKLSREERQRLTKRDTDSTKAFQAYLKGRFYSSRWTRRGWTKGIEYFNCAIAEDPEYAPAYAGLADAYYIVSNLYLPPREAIPRAKMAATKALELDDTLAEAHTSLALIRTFYDWDWRAGETEFRRAIELNPGYASAYRWYGRYLATMARFDESIVQLRRAQQLDPLSPSVNAELGRAISLSAQYDQAILQLQETLELEPNFWPAHLFLGWVYEQKGQYTEAIAILKHASTLDDNPRILASLGHTYAVSGQTDLAKDVLNKLIEQSKHGYVSPYYIAVIYTGLGKKDLAFKRLEDAYEDRSEWLVWLKVDPRLDTLRSDSRFTDLVGRIGLT